MNNKIIIVSANYYKEISKNLELGAINTLKENNYEYEVINAPGCFEIPYLIKKNIDNFEGFISLGCIIKGDTYHFEVIANETSRKIIDLKWTGAGNDDLDKSYIWIDECQKIYASFNTESISETYCINIENKQANKSVIMALNDPVITQDFIFNYLLP